MNLAELEIENNLLLNKQFLEFWKDPKTDPPKIKKYSFGTPDWIGMGFLVLGIDNKAIFSTGICQMGMFSDDVNRPIYYSKGMDITDFVYRYIDLEEILLKPK